MKTYRLDLYFQEQKGDIPGPPISRVYVKQPMIGGYKGVENTIFLTPGEYGPEVIEYQIDDLIKELEYIKSKVRAKYAAYQRKTSESRSND